MKQQTRNELCYGTIWLVRRLFRALAQHADDYLQETGLSSADRAVMEFLYPDKQLTVPAIAERYDVSRQHVQVTVNRLLDNGLLQVKTNPKHKRSQLVLLNDTGREVFSGIRRQESTIVSDLFRTASESEIKTTHRVLDKLFRQLK